MSTATSSVDLQLCAHAAEERFVNDRVVFSLEHLILVAHLPDVEHVGQHVVNDTFVEWPAATFLALLCCPRLRAPSECVELPNRLHHRLAFGVRFESMLYLLGFFAIRNELGITRRSHNVETQNRRTARPFAPAASSGDLVTCAFTVEFALELGERQQDVQDQPAHR